MTKQPSGLRQSEAILARNLFGATPADAVKFVSARISRRITSAVSVAVEMPILTELSTPAFLVDIVRLRDNCIRMREKARASGVIFRPHVKTHKTIDGARMQHGGAFGPITVSTLAEAEFFAAGGFRDITYAVPIAPEKLWRAAELASRIDRLNLLIDSELALRAMEERGHPFDVFLKIDCGYHRAGVSPDNPDSVALARRMLQSPVVRFQGVLTHAGH